MSSGEQTERATAITIENIGGINDASVEFDPGVTILTGRNATNRTSFLQAVMAATGSEDATLKADADEGAVKLDLNGKTYSRTLTRHNGRVTMDGNPYLDDPMLADLLAFLLEGNEARQAVARGDDLRELIMRPVDTDEIESEIQELEHTRDSIDDRLSELDDLTKRLPQLEEEKRTLQEQIDNKEAELTTKQDELDAIDKSVEESRSENQELDAKMRQLQETRKDIKTTHQNIKSEQESIDALQDELADQQAAFDELSPVADDRIGDLDQEMQRMRGKAEAIDQTINELQSVIQFNDEFLEEGQPEIVAQLNADPETDDTAVTDKLLAEGDTVTCWTCGTDVATKQIESNLESLRSLRQQKIQDRQSLKQDIQNLKSQKRELEEHQQRYQQLQRTIEQIETELADREETLESLNNQKDDLSSEVSQLEAEVEALQKEDHNEILEVQEAVNHLEFELDELTTELSNIEDEIDTIESQLNEREELEARRENIRAELEKLRTRVEQLQEQAIEEFNNHMEAVLDLLDYANLERIWIERVQESVREGRRKVEQERFDLHVVRSTESGTVYEDTIDHLSESEREVTGLVFALAGYLVHEVYETVPFMLIDSIEAIDAERIANLVDYLEGYAEYLVIALLDEDAAALDDSYPRITSI
jgi:chromosome segregation ATPase